MFDPDTRRFAVDRAQFQDRGEDLAADSEERRRLVWLEAKTDCGGWR